jgi:DDE domain
VDHVTLCRWVQHSTLLVVDAGPAGPRTLGGSWLVDETCAKVAGVWPYVNRVVDQGGQIVDVSRRDLPPSQQCRPSLSNPRVKGAPVSDIQRKISENSLMTVAPEREWVS